MLGITIRMSSTRNDIETPSGETYELSDKKRGIVANLVLQYLENNNYFKKSTPKGVDKKKKV